jgi:hypothetical protein
MASSSQKELGILRMAFEEHKDTVLEDTGSGMVRGIKAGSEARSVVALYGSYTTIIPVNGSGELDVTHGFQVDENCEVAAVGADDGSFTPWPPEDKEVKSSTFVNEAIQEAADNVVHFLVELEPLPITQETAQLMLGAVDLF